MIYREANTNDIPELHEIRLSVKENVLVTKSYVTNDHYVRYLTTEGKGWVCEHEGKILGFAIIDNLKNNVWALFMRPEYERQGIGRKLHELMLNWHFTLGRHKLLLGTSPGSRAETIYKIAGWKLFGTEAGGDLTYEMTYEAWQENFKGELAELS
ncbi:MAG: GNAT family N-acetyltransferase [Bacteroidota bacterium]